MKSINKVGIKKNVKNFYWKMWHQLDSKQSVGKSLCDNNCNYVTLVQFSLENASLKTLQTNLKIYFPLLYLFQYKVKNNFKCNCSYTYWST